MFLAVADRILELVESQSETFFLNVIRMLHSGAVLEWDILDIFQIYSLNLLCLRTLEGQNATSDEALV